MANWLHVRDFDLFNKTMDEDLTPSGLIKYLREKMEGDPLFAEFISEDGEGCEFNHFEEDILDLGTDPQEHANNLLTLLYDFADGERIAL